MSNTPSPAALARRWLPDVLLVIFAAVLVVFGAQFTTNGNFWLDEFFSIEMVKLDWTAIPAATAADVHPPLYYFILKLFVTVFGNAHIVYRIASFVPYVLTIVMALVLFRPAFGRFAALAFLCLMAPNVSSLRFFTEARMYGWALFFVTLCGFAAYKITDTQSSKRGWWITLTVTGLCSAYLHYFALLAVCFIYLFLLIYTLRFDRKLLRGWLIAAAVSVVCYLLWVFMAVSNILYQATGGFWLQELPALSETLDLIIGNRVSSHTLLLLLTASIITYYLLPGCGPRSSRWLGLSGLLSAVGVIALGYLASVALRPMYLSRYFFPVCGLLWLAMAVAAAGLTKRLPVVRVLLVALILYAMYEPAMQYKSDLLDVNEAVVQTVSFVEDRAQPGDSIYSVTEHVDNRVLEFFYPDCDTYAGGDLADALPDEGGSLFLVYPEEDLSPELTDQLTAAGLTVVEWQGALLDNQWCRIYYLTPQ